MRKDVPRKGNVDRNTELSLAVNSYFGDVPRTGNVDRNKITVASVRAAI